MALSGTLYGSWLGSGFQRIFVEWSATQNVTNNTSTVTATLKWQNNSTTALSSSVTKNARIIIDGVTYSGTGTVGVAAGTTKTIMTATRTISHSSDGTKSFSLIGAFDLRFTLSGTYYESTSASGVGILDTIPRATTPMVSPSIVTMGNSVTIDTPRASTAFTHTLKYSMINASGTIATGVATSQTWTVPIALANQIPNSTTGTITITCETYNGSTLIGARTTNFSAVVPHTIVPTVSIAYSGVGLYSGYYAQTKSRVSVTLNATGAYGSTISTRNTSVKSGSNTISTSSSNSFTSGIINYSGTITITTTVTDSRGRTGTASSTFTVVAYSSPRVTAFSAFRANSDGTANPQGAHIRITGSSSISPINNTNTRTTILRYRVTGSSAWTNATSNTSTYTPSLAATVSANANNSFEVQLYTADYYTSTIQTVNVGTAFVLMDFRSTGLGMAIGKVSESDAFEVAIPTNFTQAPTVNGVPIDGSSTVDVTDTRTLPGSSGVSYVPTPADLVDKSVLPLFSTGLGGGVWRSGFLVKGWSGTNYAAWSLSGPATTHADEDYYLRSGIGSDWGAFRKIWHDGNIDPTPTSRTITAGNGLSGGGTLASNRTFTLGTPGTITTTSSNGVTTTSHTHAINFDTVDSRGSNTNGSWIRFTDGTQICWNSQNHGSVSINLAWGSGFGRPLTLNNFPVAFNAVPTVSVSMRSSSNSIIFGVSSVTPSTTNPGGVEPYRATSATVSNFTTHYVAVGTWK